MSKTFLARAEHALGNTSVAVDLLAQAQSALDQLGAFRSAATAVIHRIGQECLPSAGSVPTAGG